MLLTESLIDALLVADAVAGALDRQDSQPTASHQRGKALYRSLGAWRLLPFDQEANINPILELDRHESGYQSPREALKVVFVGVSTPVLGGNGTPMDNTVARSSMPQGGEGSSTPATLLSTSSPTPM